MLGEREPYIVKTYLRLNPSQRVILSKKATLSDPMPGEKGYPEPDEGILQLAKDVICAGPSMWASTLIWRRVVRLANEVCCLHRENRRLHDRLAHAEACLRDGSSAEE